jgi:hypothetical protein
MRWQTLTLYLCSALGGILLADYAFSLRFLFPGGSIGRLFFFNVYVDLAAFFSPFAAVCAYISGFKKWTVLQRVLFAILGLIPVLSTLWFIARVIVLAQDPSL